MKHFLTVFESVPDPRAENVQHDLAEILIIAFLAVLCGARHCSEMAAFGCAKLKFLKRFLKLRHGIPSHDTFSTVFRMLDPKALDVAFGALTSRLVEALEDGAVVAVDGKSLKGAYDKGKAHAPKMMVSAYAAGLRLTLATVAARDRNEVDAALEVLGLIDLKGKIVTGDALRRVVDARSTMQSQDGRDGHCQGRRLLPGAEGQPEVAFVGRARLSGKAWERTCRRQDRMPCARALRDPRGRRCCRQGARRIP